MKLKHDEPLSNVGFNCKLRRYTTAPPRNGDPVRDSDDEEDLEAWAREDSRHLSDFEDVVKSEKRFMHDWNRFMRQYKLCADRELPAAYEARPLRPIHCFLSLS